LIFPALDGRGEGRVMKNKRLIPLAKNLRKRATAAERLLWRYLRAKQMEGIKFRRQDLLEIILLTLYVLIGE